MKEVIERLEKEIEEIDEMMPWKHVAKAAIIANRSPLELHMVGEGLWKVLMEYRLLLIEVEGMKEYPEKWKGMEEHPFCHVETIKKLLKEVKIE